MTLLPGVSPWPESPSTLPLMAPPPLLAASLALLQLPCSLSTLCSAPEGTLHSLLPSSGKCLL